VSDQRQVVFKRNVANSMYQDFTLIEVCQALSSEHNYDAYIFLRCTSSSLHELASVHEKWIEMPGGIVAGRMCPTITLVCDTNNSQISQRLKAVNLVAAVAALLCGVPSHSLLHLPHNVIVQVRWCLSKGVYDEVLL